ncbi:MAG TPA: hypothetical protein VJR02_08700 [Pyrinomonadaceae bacterium]|nr:hypothetical protein [Pyrinomonadaceae bacterium]
MKECPACNSRFQDEINDCQKDGTPTLVALLADRYILERRRGYGGMGIVYKARHRFLNRPHAVKVILPTLACQPRFVTRLHQGALAMAAMSPRKIVTATDFGLHNRLPFLVMEFIAGECLRLFLEREDAVPPARTLENIRALCDGDAAPHGTVGLNVMGSEYYLFASQPVQPEQTARTVFYRLKGDSIARALCDLFTNQFGEFGETFTFEQRKAFSVSNQVLLDEAIEALELYDDPDPGIYDPPPPTYVITLAQYAMRARTWERLLREKMTDVDLKTDADAEEAQATTEDELSTMPPEDQRNSGLIVLMLVAQAYYKLLESSISMASWCTALDVELNDAYFWTIKMITTLLKNHEDLKEFPMAFEPILPDLYPSTIRDMDWEDIASEADGFLSTVQQYVHSKGIYDPEHGSPAWVFVELYRPGVNRAIERANAYHKRMRDYCQQRFGTPKMDPALTENAKTVTKTIVELDLVGYSSISRNVEESLDVRTVAQVNQQIHGFIDLGLKAANSSQDNVMSLTGDGAILAFDSAEQAHTFAEAINRATQEHNRKRKDRFAMRVFRIGAATGEIVMQRKPGGGYDVAGSTIARAVRLEAKAAPGGFLVDQSTFEGLSPAQKLLYGPKHVVAGKRDEEFEAYACQLNTDGPTDAAEFTSAPQPQMGGDLTQHRSEADKRTKILTLIRELQRHQYLELVFLLEIPIGQRPSETLNLDQQKLELLKWADENKKIDTTLDVLDELTKQRGA